jgi:DMSO/TMAO reductase YedYZ molybdopterin-dependent catalytic subunit
MKKPYWLVLVVLLVGLLAGCSQESAAPGNVLIVTDGTSEQSYGVDDLEALGAEEAAFRDITYVGVPLGLLLEDAGFDPAGVSAVKATAADGFSANYDPDLVNRPDTLVAYAQADGPLAEEDGAFRMVLPDQEGKLNPRDLVELRIYP